MPPTSAPKPIILYGGGPAFGLPEVSPYTMKTQIQLQIAGLPYTQMRARPDQSPKGQLPFITDGNVKLGDVTVADSTFIRAYLEAKYGIDLDAGLDPVQRATAWAMERMLENHFGWAMSYFRYADEASFARGPARWFDAAPEEIRAKLRQELRDKVMANLRAAGITRHGHDEVLMLATKSLRALSLLLGDNAYLFGSRATGTDAIAGALLANALAPFFDNALRRRAEGFGNLVAYVDRMMARFYPDFAWKTACGSGAAEAAQAA